MRCNKCGAPNPDDRRLCQLCGHKLQSGRAYGGESGEAGEGGRAAADAAESGRDAGKPRRTGGDDVAPAGPAPADETGQRASRLLDFQGWANPRHSLGPYLEACLYAAALAAGVAGCLWFGVVWPLYPLAALLGLLAWRRRL